MLLQIILTVYMSLSAAHIPQKDHQNPFYENYKKYHQQAISNRRFKHGDLAPLLQEMKGIEGVTVQKIGESVQGRDISMVSMGTGKTSVLLWSQMHGDEATATMALMDIFNFFSASDALNPYRKIMLDKLTIHFIPMLNPDGAQAFKRRNAMDIDLNRDALRLQAPEAQLLKRVRDSLKADFGFNLHDQNTRYTVGKTNKPATISFLAPAYDEQKSVHEGRENAMQVIADLNNTLQRIIPNQVAKYDDEYEPRAFGDNMQKWGTSTILIESGGYHNDPEKQYIRKINFVAILQGLLSIATQSYKNFNTDQYFSIPDNRTYLFDLLVRNAQVAVEGKQYMLDLGINRREQDDEGSRAFSYVSTLEDIGDLSVFYGYQEIDARGMTALPGKVYASVFKNFEALEKADLHAILAAGHTTVQLAQMPAEEYINKLPVNIVKAGTEKAHPVQLYGRPNFILQENNKVHYAIVNGFIYNVRTRENQIINALD